MDASTVLHWILLSIIWGVISPYVIYTLYIYIAYKRQMVYFRKRKPLLIDIVIGLVLSGILIENQLLIFLSLYNKQNNVFGEFLRFFNISTMIAIYMVIMIRIYLLYFQSQYNEATISSKWKEYVNEEYEDFFLSNIHTYGNDKFLIKLSSIIWIIVCIIYIIFESFLESTGVSAWFIFVIFFFLFLFAVYIWRKFPDFHDTLHIEKELKYFVALNFIVLFVWTILLAISSAFTDGIIRYYLQVLMYTLIFWISINGVIRWNEIKMNVVKNGDNTNDIYYKQMNDGSFGLQQILSTNKGYNQFMKFLVTEFSTENLLFVTEYIQLKNILSLSDKEMKSLKLTYSMELPDNIPIPKIIQDLNLDLEAIKANQKYRKEKKLKREKEIKKKLMDEIIAKNKNKNNNNNDDDIDDIKEDKKQKLISPIMDINNCGNVHFLHVPISPSGDMTMNIVEEEHEEINNNKEPIPSSPDIDVDTDDGDISPQSPSYHGGNISIDVIKEDEEEEKVNIDTRIQSINSNESNYISEERAHSTPTMEPTIECLTYSEENTVIRHNNNSADDNDLYIGVTEIATNDKQSTPTPTTPPFHDNDDDETMMMTLNVLKAKMISIDRAKSEEIQTNTNIKKRIEQKRPFLKLHKSLSDAKLEDKDEDKKEEKEENNNNNNNIFNNYEKETFVEKLKCEQNKKIPYLMRARTDLSMVPSSSSTNSISIGNNINNNKYSKDDINTLYDNNNKNSNNYKKTRHQSLSIKYTINKNRIRNNTQILSNHIRNKSKKMKIEMLYHMREASNSMALKNKKHLKFNVLDCKSFSILCSKLYYKYIATGVAPLEVNISSATRIRCNNIFQFKSTITTTTNINNNNGKRPRTMSKGIANLISGRTSSLRRNDAIDILKGYNDGLYIKGIKRSKSAKKLSMMNNPDEPFNGDIVMAMSQLLPPLEQCAIELTNLLKDSLRRFKKTKVCWKLYIEYIEKK